ncbi:MAG: endonuclease/exonuclease/phosphatase family protein [Parabacteroides sp.]|nr:endonuclease/exonuclease/phosphatase family protein [Parabacteroides sp.]
MRRCNSILIVVLCLFGFISLAAAKGKCDMRVASFNLRQNNPGDGDDAWPKRAKAVAQFVRFHDFDIFGTQEGFKSMLDDIIEGGGYAYTGKGRDDGKDGGEHSAIIYKTDRFQLLDSGDFWYAEKSDVPGKGWDAVCCNRICSWGKFKDKISGKMFYFFNSHFDHQGVVARRESSKLLLSKIKAIAGNMPVLCTGDFNATPESEPIKIILADGLLKDSRAISEKTPYGPEGTFQDFQFSSPMKMRIDYIFVTKSIRILKYGVLTDTLYGHFMSDHCPAMADVEF